jgi:EAL domain-containing protein (putative c-di-GMP-specific phosphodiesterase class I)
MERLELETDSARRSNGAVELHYQPILSLVTSSNWRALVAGTARFGLVLPNEPHPIAEETGLIVQIGRWVEACAKPRAVEVGEDLAMSVNSWLPSSIRAIDEIEQRCARSTLPSVKLEITKARSTTCHTRKPSAESAACNWRSTISAPLFMVGLPEALSVDALKIDRSFAGHGQDCATRRS